MDAAVLFFLDGSVDSAQSCCNYFVFFLAVDVYGTVFEAVDL